jgi:hypothetical protein
VSLKWYNVRKKGVTRWTAYEMSDFARLSLGPDYEVTGPHKNLVACMIAANEQKGGDDGDNRTGQADRKNDS